MSSAKLEVEAKFIIPEATTLAALQSTSRLGEFVLIPLQTQAVFDRYLDTADRRLLQAGFACRIRTVNDQKLLTLKSLTPAEDHIHRRQEIEMEIETDQPQAWAEGEAGRLLLEIAGTSSLQTLFDLHQTRHQFRVCLAKQPVIELSLDEVSLREAETVDYFELEAELIGTGTEADLARFIEILKSKWALIAEIQSKFERGLAYAGVKLPNT